jgi:hypothetical protein
VPRGALPWNGRRPLQELIVTKMCPWFDHMIACAIWRRRVCWNLNATGEMCKVFDFLLTMNCPMKALCTNSVLVRRPITHQWTNNNNNNTSALGCYCWGDLIIVSIFHKTWHLDQDSPVLAVSPQSHVCSIIIRWRSAVLILISMNYSLSNETGSWTKDWYVCSTL